MNTIIYALVDELCQPIYIGKTNNSKNRLLMHKKRFENISFIELESVNDEDAIDREMDWINYFIYIGAKLKNKITNIKNKFNKYKSNDFSSLRKLFGFNLVDMAKHLEIPYNTYRNYEYGYNKVPDSTIIKLKNMCLQYIKFKTGFKFNDAYKFYKQMQFLYA